MDSTIAKLLTIPTSFLLSGYYLSASQNTLPNIYAAPAPFSTKTFTGVYARGMPVAVTGALITTASATYLAYTESAQRAQYGATAALAFGVLPFTRVVMMRGIKRLMSLAKDGREAEKAGESGEVEGLLRAWAKQNFIRCAMSFAAGMIALVATH